MGSWITRHRSRRRSVSAETPPVIAPTSAATSVENHTRLAPDSDCRYSPNNAPATAPIPAPCSPRSITQPGERRPPQAFLHAKDVPHGNAEQHRRRGRSQDDSIRRGSDEVARESPLRRFHPQQNARLPLPRRLRVKVGTDQGQQYGSEAQHPSRHGSVVPYRKQLHVACMIRVWKGGAGGCIARILPAGKVRASCGRGLRARRVRVGHAGRAAAARTHARTASLRRRKVNTRGSPLGSLRGRDEQFPPAPAREELLGSHRGMATSQNPFRRRFIQYPGRRRWWATAAIRIDSGRS